MLITKIFSSSFATLLILLTPLFKIARIRLHGFSECEISIVRAELMSDIESAYLERDQMQSTSLRDKYLQVYPNFGLRQILSFTMSCHLFRNNNISSFFWQHFLRNDPVSGIEYMAQLQKTLLPRE